MNRVFVDTYGQSVIGFAVSYLLHFGLYPRLKAINKQKLYYIDSGDKNKYKDLAEILKGSINCQLTINYIIKGNSFKRIEIVEKV